MNYLQIDKASICDGLGFRVVLWVSGCNVGCPQCQNPETWDFSAGKLFDDSAKKKLFEFMDKPWVKGITITGGHPLEPENRLDIALLLKNIRAKFPEKDIWLYTGYRLPDDLKAPIWSFVQDCDVVVDGPFIEGMRDVTIAFRGSTNQRIIDIKETIKNKKIVVMNLEGKY